MTLRVRLALYAALTVVLALGLSGLALREKLRAFLVEQAERELRALLEVVVPRLVSDEDGILRLDLNKTLFAALKQDTLVLVVGPEGIQDAVGFLPSPAELEALMCELNLPARLRATPVRLDLIIWKGCGVDGGAARCA